MQQSATVESSTRVIELIVHNESSDSEALNSVTNEWLNSFTTQNPVFRILETAKAPGSDFVSSVSNEIYRLEVSEISNELHEVIDHLQREWVKSVSQNSRQDLWLEVSDVGISPEALASSKHTIEISFLSMGCFLSPGVYSRHWNSERSHHSQPRINVSFEYDRHEIDIRYKNIENQTWKFETSFEHIHKLLLVTPCERTCQIYLFLKNPLKLCLAVRQVPSVDSSPSDLLGMPDDGPEEAHYSWVREVRFDDCSREIIGSSSVVCLGIENRGTTGAMNNVIARLRKLGFTVVVGNPRVQDAKEHEQIKVPDFQNFRLTYSWHCLRSRGFKVTDQVTEELVTQLNSLQQEPWLETALEAVIREVDSRIVCTIARQFEEEIEKRRSPDATGIVLEDVAVPNVVFVRRVIFTPTALKLLAEEWTLENRVIRKFGSDRFIRVSIRDVDFKPLTSTFVSVENITKEIINFLTYGLRIGSRHYRFLGCSNSQLRSHGVWMYASDGTKTVESIREWMGDLSHEKCVATYVKRLGQCFTTTKDSVKVNRIERIDDVKVDGANGGYCFTDGIGRISTTLALKVTKALRLKPSHAPPSAFQIRLGGCKGVVALAPELGEEEALQIRPSMEKYLSEHDELDVADHTKPIRLSLNRQVILLMSGLGVKDDAFFKLQDKMLNDLARIFIDEDHAVAIISETDLNIDRIKLMKSGLVVTLEPFLRHILKLNYAKRLDDLLRKTHLEIPSDKGRLMMGTVDEYGSLKYGEVFVQYSKEFKAPGAAKKVIVQGTVVATKNPCFHPGDLRKFQAVDRTELHHMVDCIVFPADGPRPHPNEMSGSDLDGDMYFVCWDETLIPPGDNEGPMDFTGQCKKEIKEQVTEADMIDFIAHYINGDQLGVIANAHLVHADAHPKGVFCDSCLKIAHLHSDAVDFIKTGQVEKIPPELRPKCYPDYMMKSDKQSYISKTVIAKLYHQCCAVEDFDDFGDPGSAAVDWDLLYPGYESYLKEAGVINAWYNTKIDELTDMYGIKTDAEIYSVGILGIKHRLGHLKGDRYAIDEIVKLRLKAIRKKAKEMFYRDFGRPNEQSNDEVITLQKASAVYFVAYCSNDEQELMPNRLLTETKTSSESYTKIVQGMAADLASENKVTEEPRRNLGLPWIFWKQLCEIKRKNLELKREQGCTSMPTSFLQKMSSEIATFLISEDSRRKRKVELFSVLNQRCMKDGLKGKLILFGSTVLDVYSDSATLDILIKFDDSSAIYTSPFNHAEMLKQTGERLANHIGGHVSKQYCSKQSNKMKISNVPKTDIEITLYCFGESAKRTVYVLAAVMANQWTIPVLRVLLAWGKNSGVTSANSKDGLLSDEELVILFFHAAIKELKCCRQVSNEVLEATENLLSLNHFINCPPDQCTHAIEATGSSDIDDLALRFQRLPVVYSSESVASDSSGSEILPAKILLEFFKFYSANRGEAFREIQDPGASDELRKLLNLKDAQCIQLGEHMTRGLHSLAKCVTINDFLNQSGKDNQRFAKVLPIEVSLLFRNNESGWGQKLKSTTGADVLNIRKKAFRWDQTGHFIEAWGSFAAIRRLIVRVRDIIGLAGCFTAGDIGRFWEIEGSRRVVFDGISGPEGQLKAIPDKGRCQFHDFKKLRQTLVAMIPVRPCDDSDAYNLLQVVEFFNEQRELIRKHYDKDIHGGIRLAVSFGKYYTTGYSRGVYEASDVRATLLQRPEWNKAVYVSNSIRGSKTPRSRYEHSHRGTPRPLRSNLLQGDPRQPNWQPHHSTPRQLHWQSHHTTQRQPLWQTPHNCRQASGKGNFIPADNVNLDRIEGFLTCSKFSETAHRCEYRVTVDPEGIIVLNEKMQMTLIHLNDIKWLTINVLRGRSDLEEQISDIRISIQSRPVIEQLNDHPGCQKYLKNSHQLLHLDDAGNVDGVQKEHFKQYVSFMRYKDMTTYRFQREEGMKDDDSILHRVALKLNCGKEYRKPVNGIFNKISIQTEVLLETELPDLDDKEACDEFIKEIYRFSKQFAREVID